MDRTFPDIGKYPANYRKRLTVGNQPSLRRDLNSVIRNAMIELQQLDNSKSEEFGKADIFLERGVNSRYHSRVRT